MDNKSVKVLAYLKGQTDPVSKEQIIKEFGSDAAKSLAYLKENRFITEGSMPVSVSFDHVTGRATHNYGPNSMFEIASEGLDFLQHKPWNDFDRWLNRFSLLFSIIGGALLSKPLWAAIEWVWNWLVLLSSQIP